MYVYIVLVLPVLLLYTDLEFAIWKGPLELFFSLSTILRKQTRFKNTKFKQAEKNWKFSF